MSFRLANRAGQAVLLNGEDYWALGIDPMDALARPQELHRRWSGRGAPDGQVSPAELGPPVPAPCQVFAYGLNYRDHIEEMDEVDYLGRTTNEAPVVFTKFPSCLVGPAAPVKLVGDRCDYECEMVAVIGAETRDIDESKAWERVAGLMIGQDISDRALQVAATPPQFNLGKSRETLRPHRPRIGEPRPGGQPRRSGHLLSDQRRAAPEQPHQLSHAPRGRDGGLPVVDPHPAPRRPHIYRHPRRRRPRPGPLPQARRCDPLRNRRPRRDGEHLRLGQPLGSTSVRSAEVPYRKSLPM